MLTKARTRRPWGLRGGIAALRQWTEDSDRYAKILPRQSIYTLPKR